MRLMLQNKQLLVIIFIVVVFESKQKNVFGLFVKNPVVEPACLSCNSSIYYKTSDQWKVNFVCNKGFPQRDLNDTNDCIIKILTRNKQNISIIFHEFYINAKVYTCNINGENCREANIETTLVEIEYAVLKISLDKSSVSSRNNYGKFLERHGFNITIEMFNRNYTLSPSSTPLYSSYKSCMGNGYSVLRKTYSPQTGLFEGYKYTCECVKGNYGPQCRHHLQKCPLEKAHNYCNNNGRCSVIYGNQTVCHCDDEYFGPNCRYSYTSFYQPFHASHENCKNTCQSNKCHVITAVRPPKVMCSCNVGYIRSKNSLNHTVCKPIRGYKITMNKTDVRFDKLKNLLGPRVFSLPTKKSSSTRTLKMSKSYLRKILTYVSSNNITTIPSYLTMQTMEHMWAVGDILIVQCIAEGSENLVFQWYKDGQELFHGAKLSCRNVTSHWNQSIESRISYSCVSEQHIILKVYYPGITTDSGLYKCKVSDGGEEASRELIVYNYESPFNAEIVPEKMYVLKGDNATVDINIVDCFYMGSNLCFSKLKQDYIINCTSAPMYNDVTLVDNMNKKLIYNNVSENVKILCVVNEVNGMPHNNYSIELPSTINIVDEDDIWCWDHKLQNYKIYSSEANCGDNYATVCTRVCDQHLINLNLDFQEVLPREIDCSYCLPSDLVNMITYVRKLDKQFINTALTSIGGSLFSYLQSRNITYPERKSMLEILEVLDKHEVINVKDYFNILSHFYKNTLEHDIFELSSTINRKLKSSLLMDETNFSIITSTFKIKIRNFRNHTASTTRLRKYFIEEILLCLTCHRSNVFFEIEESFNRDLKVATVSYASLDNQQLMESDSVLKSELHFFPIEVIPFYTDVNIEPNMTDNYTDSPLKVSVTSHDINEKIIMTFSPCPSYDNDSLTHVCGQYNYSTHKWTKNSNFLEKGPDCSCQYDEFGLFSLFFYEVAAEKIHYKDFATFFCVVCCILMMIVVMSIVQSPGQYHMIKILRLLHCLALLSYSIMYIVLLRASLSRALVLFVTWWLVTSYVIGINTGIAQVMYLYHYYGFTKSKFMKVISRHLESFVIFLSFGIGYLILRGFTHTSTSSFESILERHKQIWDFIIHICLTFTVWLLLMVKLLYNILAEQANHTIFVTQARIKILKHQVILRVMELVTLLCYNFLYNHVCQIMLPLFLLLQCIAIVVIYFFNIDELEIGFCTPDIMERLKGNYGEKLGRFECFYSFVEKKCREPYVESEVTRPTNLEDDNSVESRGRLGSTLSSTSLSNTGFGDTTDINFTSNHLPREWNNNSNFLNRQVQYNPLTDFRSKSLSNDRKFVRFQFKDNDLHKNLRRGNNFISSEDCVDGTNGSIYYIPDDNFALKRVGGRPRAYTTQPITGNSLWLMPGYLNMSGNNPPENKINSIIDQNTSFKPYENIFSSSQNNHVSNAIGKLPSDNKSNILYHNMSKSTIDVNHSSTSAAKSVPHNGEVPHYSKYSVSNDNRNNHSCKRACSLEDNRRFSF